MPIEINPQSDHTISRCPNCGLIYTAGGLTCSHCGMPFVTRMKGGKKPNTNPESPAVHARSEKDQKSVILYCGSKRMSIAVADCLVIGRRSDIPGDAQPDIDLSEFDAHNKGVSRQHIKIVRKGDSVQVIDLGSSNCTLLNGLPLTPHIAKELRNSDELRLGALNLRIAL